MEEAKYLILNKTTARDAAKIFGVSKSTVHKDVAERLPRINPSIALQIRKILDCNLADRHNRGGRATQLKYGRDMQ